MGFPLCYTEVFIPRLFVHAIYVLGFVRNLTVSLFTLLGLSSFLETDISSSSSSSYSWPENPARFSRSGSLIRELLPVVKLEDLSGDDGSGSESCAVCLYEVKRGEEIRWLKNCKHVFHKGCIDRWLDHGRDTCPLCRSPLVPDDLREEFRRRFWGVVSESDYDDFNQDFGVGDQF